MNLHNIRVVNENIVDMDVDCVVNAANSHLMQGSGVCGAIFHAAGSEKLRNACQEIGYCKCGRAVITSGFGLKAKYIIHAVGPIWHGGTSGEPELLYACYQNSLDLLVAHGGKSIAFPFISSGIYGYPKEEAWERAFRACIDYMEAHKDIDIQIYFATISAADAEAAERCLVKNLSLLPEE